MEILIGVATWSIVALFLSVWIANGAKREELKNTLIMTAFLFVILDCAFLLAEIF